MLAVLSSTASMVPRGAIGLLYGVAYAIVDIVAHIVTILRCMVIGQRCLLPYDAAPASTRRCVESIRLNFTNAVSSLLKRYSSREGTECRLLTIKVFCFNIVKYAICYLHGQLALQSVSLHQSSYRQYIFFLSYCTLCLVQNNKKWLAEVNLSAILSLVSGNQSDTRHLYSFRVWSAIVRCSFQCSTKALSVPAVHGRCPGMQIVQYGSTSMS